MHVAKLCYTTTDYPSRLRVSDTIITIHRQVLTSTQVYPNPTFFGLDLQWPVGDLLLSTVGSQRNTPGDYSAELWMLHLC